ncbi:DUF397 domain-containing protein [Streptomyces sp. NPDC000941]
MSKPSISGTGDDWFKSSYSSAGATECVEASFRAGGIAVRDSKEPERAVLAFSARTWENFVAALGRGQVGSV